MSSSPAAAQSPVSEPSGEPYDYQATMQPERPYMLPYHQSLVYFSMLATRGGDGKLDKLYLKFENVLENIRKVYHLSAGIPQVLYIIGWHHEGHDSKYPDWSEVNPHLKREQDATALDSLRWLIREARQYNCVVSLHLNMFDAYTDSPLWDEYVDKDVIAKDKDGNVIPGKAWGGMTSYQISYKREWELGLAQRRIDGILEMIPELVEGGTIHIDAFLGARPLDREAPISPYLGYTKEQEVATIRKIYRYFRDRGVDVTSEWVNGFRDDRMVGLQAWCWHGGSAVEDVPDSLYCTNVMEASRELRWDLESEEHADWKREFFLKVLPWFYSNHPDGGEVPEQAIDGTDICLPALWCDQPTLTAYSEKGCENKPFAVPDSWKGKSLASAKLTADGREDVGMARNGVLAGESAAARGTHSAPDVDIITHDPVAVAIDEVAVLGGVALDVLAQRADVLRVVLSLELHQAVALHIRLPGHQKDLDVRGLGGLRFTKGETGGNAYQSCHESMHLHCSLLLDSRRGQTTCPDRCLVKPAAYLSTGRRGCYSVLE